MELIRFQCPSCGAELPPKAPTGEIACEYCGSRFAPEGAGGARTVSGAALDRQGILDHIQKAQAELAATQERIAAAREREAEAAAKLARTRSKLEREKRRKRGRGDDGPGLLRRLLRGAVTLAIFLFAAGMIVAGLIAEGVFELEDIPFLGELGVARELNEDLVTEGVDPWGGPPQLVDIAGQPALVARVRNHHNRHMYVDAYTLPAGERLWRIGPLATTERELEHVRFAVVGPWVVVSPNEAKLFVHELETGERVRTVKLRDRVNYLCPLREEQRERFADGEGSPIYVRVDGRRHQLLIPETGELERQRKVPAGCEFDRTVSPDPRFHEIVDFDDELDDHKFGWAVVDGSRGAAFAVAKDEGESGEQGEQAETGGRGTQAPVVLGFSVPEESERALARRLKNNRARKLDVEAADWVTPLDEPAKDWPVAADADDGRAFVVWASPEGDSELAAFDLETGERQWSHTLEREIGDRIITVRAGGELLIVVRTHLLEIRAVDDGALLGTLGEAPG